MALIEILSPIVQFITTIILDLGYIGIFLLMVFESALIPDKQVDAGVCGCVDVVLPVAVAGLA